MFTQTKARFGFISLAIFAFTFLVSGFFIFNTVSATPTSDTSVKQVTPIFDVVGGEVATGTPVTITSAGADAIYYTTDGTTTPGTSEIGATSLYTAPIIIDTAKTIKAIAVKSGNTNSEIGSATYTIATPKQDEVGSGDKGNNQPEISSNVTTDPTAPAVLEVGADKLYKTIQSAIDAAKEGDIVKVYPGTYSETASNRDVNGASYQFGIFVGTDKDGLTIEGVDASGSPTTDYKNVMATITTTATNNFGPSGVFISGNNVTIQGLNIGSNLGGMNKSIEVIGDNFTFQYSIISEVEGGDLYINDFSGASNIVNKYNVLNNWFSKGATLDIANGAGASVDSPATDRQIIGNTFSGAPSGWTYALISFNGTGGQPWYANTVGGAIITDNNFSGSTQYIRARGEYNNDQFDWKSYWNNNTFDKKVVDLSDATKFEVQPFSYDTFTNVRRIGSLIQPEINNAQANNTIYVGSGDYDSFSVVDKSNLTIMGAGKTATTITPSTLINTGIAHKYLTNTQASVFINDSTDIAISDMTINSNNKTPGSGGPDAIVFWNSSTGSIKNCAITGTYVIDGMQTGQGIAIDASGSKTSDLIVDNCNISGFQKNGIEALDGNGATSGSTDTINLTVKNTTITGVATAAIAQNGIVVWSRGGGTVTGTVDSSTISNFNYTVDNATATGILAYGGGKITTVSNSKLSNNDISISVVDSPIVNAANNWWGGATGPYDNKTLPGTPNYNNLTGTGSPVSSYVDYKPWFTTSEMTPPSVRTIKIKNVVLPSNTDVFWNFGITDGVLWNTWKTDGYDSGEITVSAGKHSVDMQNFGTEGQRYSSTLECKDGDTVVATAGPAFLPNYDQLLMSPEFEVQDGHHVVCTYTNTLAGTIELRNVASPVDTNNWNFGIDASYTYWDQQKSNGYTSGPITVTEGNHSVVGQVGYNDYGFTDGTQYISTLECKDGDAVVATANPSSLKYGDNLVSSEFKVAGGQHIICTFTNTKKAPVLTDTTAPEIPVQISPVDGSILTTDKLSSIDWSDVTDTSAPVTYVYQSSNTSETNLDGSFVSPVYTSGILANSEISTLGTPEGTYYWHVRAIDNLGNSSNWSSSWKVIVDNTIPEITNPTTDVCPNIEGDQSVIPNGQYLDTNGNCVSSVSNRRSGSYIVLGQNIGTSTEGQVLGAEKFNFTQLMKKGSKGDEVIELQKFLNTIGHNSGLADSNFGPKTKAATIKFQIANGLIGDGIVGPLTRAVLNK